MNGRSLLIAFGLVLAVASIPACGTSDNAPASQQGTDGGGASGHDSGGGTGGSGECNGSCDDGFNCTLDSCSSGACQHTIGQNSGATACPSGQYCTLQKGCIPPPACKTSADCVELWAPDACKDNVRCELATSICLFDVLDKDKDGHPPQICGGDDCDDSDPSRFPGKTENCDGKDNNCNGKTDDGAFCVEPLACLAGACSCPPENSCTGECVDKQHDLKNCGACGKACNPGFSCQSGQCMCPHAVCGSTCTDTSSDPKNCGTCGHACSDSEQCTNGNCKCPSGEADLCSGTCVDLGSSEKNCGKCGTVCAPQTECVAGACICPSGESLCGTDCVDFFNDIQNCGGCGVTCGDSNGASSCIKGACKLTCNPTWGDCNGKLSDGCEESLDSQTHCGSCGAACSNGTCASGKCMTSLVSSGATCSLKADASYLYYLDTGGVVRKVPVTGGATTSVATPASLPSAIAVGGGFVYWIRASDGVVERVSTNGGGPTVLATGQQGLKSITADQNGVYWTTTHEVMGALGLTSPYTITSGLTAAFNISLDSTDSYWSDATSIRRAPKQGGTPIVAVAAIGDPVFAVNNSGVVWQQKKPTLHYSLMLTPKGGGAAQTVADDWCGSRYAEVIALPNSLIYLRLQCSGDPVGMGTLGVTNLTTSQEVFVADFTGASPCGLATNGTQVFFSHFGAIKAFAL